MKTELEVGCKGHALYSWLACKGDGAQAGTGINCRRQLWLAFTVEIISLLDNGAATQSVLLAVSEISALFCEGTCVQ